MIEIGDYVWFKITKNSTTARHYGLVVGLVPLHSHIFGEAFQGAKVKVSDDRSFTLSCSVLHKTTKLEAAIAKMGDSK